MVVGILPVLKSCSSSKMISMTSSQSSWSFFLDFTLLLRSGGSIPINLLIFSSSSSVFPFAPSYCLEMFLKSSRASGTALLLEHSPMQRNCVMSNAVRWANLGSNQSLSIRHASIPLCALATILFTCPSEYFSTKFQISPSQTSTRSSGYEFKTLSGMLDFAWFSAHSMALSAALPTPGRLLMKRFMLILHSR